MSELFDHHHRRHISGNHAKQPPLSWKDFHAGKRNWLAPVLYLDWLSQWAVYWLSRFSFLELLEYCSSFSLLIAVIVYFAESGQRTEARHYQAWQVINSAQGQTGSGGRIQALESLNEDHVSLVGVNVSDAFLQDIRLEHADLSRGNFASADLRDSHLAGTNFSQANLNSANLRQSDLTGVDVINADIGSADLAGATLTNLQHWDQIENIRGADLSGVQNPPDGFLAWAASHGAITSEPATTSPVR